MLLIFHNNFNKELLHYYIIKCNLMSNILLLIISLQNQSILYTQHLSILTSQDSQSKNHVRLLASVQRFLRVSLLAFWGNSELYLLTEHF